MLVEETLGGFGQKKYIVVSAAILQTATMAVFAIVTPTGMKFLTWKLNFQTKKLEGLLSDANS